MNVKKIIVMGIFFSGAQAFWFAYIYSSLDPIENDREIDSIVRPSKLSDSEDFLRNPLSRYTMPFYSMNVNINPKDPIAEQLAQAVKGGFGQGIVYGISGPISIIIKESFSGIVRIVPFTSRIISRCMRLILNILCGRGKPFTVQELALWESVVEQIITTLTDARGTSNLMLRSMQLIENMDQDVDPTDLHWAFYTQQVTQICTHIIDYIQDRLTYYDRCLEKKDSLNGKNKVFLGIGWLRTMVESLDDHDCASIVFLGNSINQQLNHIIFMVSNAHRQEQLDIQYVSTIGHTALLLFKKIRILIKGPVGQDSLSTAGMNNSLSLIT